MNFLPFFVKKEEKLNMKRQFYRLGGATRSAIIKAFKDWRLNVRGGLIG